MKIFTYLASACLLLLHSVQAGAAIAPQERQALTALYNSTAGAAWHNSSNWNGTAGTECNWYGVSCSADGSTITALNLAANNLRGNLPSSLTTLTSLISSDLRFNAIYSHDQNLIDFLDARGPVGSLLDTQTLDATGVVFSNVSSTGFDISWDAVAYQQSGGYRLYMAEQIDGTTGSAMTEYVPVAEIKDKNITTTTLNGLIACRQYFVKVVSYTLAHADNSNLVESDGMGSPILGTIAGFGPECKLVGGQYYDQFKLVSGGATLTNFVVLITVAPDSGRVYDIVYTGDDITVASIDGAAGSDDISIVANNNITVTGTIISGNLTLSVGAGAGDSPSLTAEQCETGSVTISQGGSISTTEPAILPGCLTTELGGGEIPFGEGVIVLSNGFGSMDIAENTAIGAMVTEVSVQFLGRDEFVSELHYTLSKGNDEGVFAINSKNGQITLARTLDFEQIAQYSLEVTASDGGASYTGKVVVNVTDIAEQQPVGGCSLRGGSSFDAGWLILLGLAGLHYLRRFKTF